MRTETTVRDFKPDDVNHHLVAAVNRQKHATAISAHANDQRRLWMRQPQQRVSTMHQGATAMQGEDVDGRACLNPNVLAAAVVGFLAPT